MHCLWKKWRLLTYKPAFLTMYHYLSAIRKPLTASEHLACWLVSDYYISLGNWLILIIFFSFSVACKKDSYTMDNVFSTFCQQGEFCSFLSNIDTITTSLPEDLNCVSMLMVMVVPIYWEGIPRYNSKRLYM